MLTYGLRSPDRSGVIGVLVCLLIAALAQVPAASGQGFENTTQAIWNTFGVPQLGEIQTATFRITGTGQMNYMIVGPNDTNTPTAAVLWVSGWESGNGRVGIGTTSAGTAKLAVMDGSVGIGTTAPDATLDVIGNAHVSQNVTVGAAPAYSVLPLSGSGDPSGDAALGQIYVDTTAHDAWVFVGAGTWKKITCCQEVGVQTPTWGSLKKAHRK